MSHRPTLDFPAPTLIAAAAALACGVGTPAATAQCGSSLAGRFGGETSAVAQIEAGTLLVGRGAALELLQLTNPSAPAPFSPARRVPLNSLAAKIVYTPGSGRAFVLLDTGEVDAVTVSTSPTASISALTPVTTGRFNVDIAASGQVVYIDHLDEDDQGVLSSIRIYDLSSGSPRYVRTIDPFLRNYGFDRIVKVGNTIWLGMHEFESSLLGAEAYDVSNPSAPVRVTSSLNSTPLGTFTRISAMTAIGNKLILSYLYDTPTQSAEDWMRAVDISNPASPQWYPPVDLNGFAGCMSSTGNLLRISIKGSGIGTWDTTNPAAMTWLGAYFSDFPEVGQMVAGPSTDYWAAGRGGLMTMNEANAASPSARSTLDTLPVGPSVVRQSGNTTAVLDYTLNTLRLYDYTLPEGQQLRSSFFLPLWSTYMELGSLAGGSQTIACVATEQPGSGDSISIIDITNPAAPVTRGTIPNVEVQLMSVTNSRLYVFTSSREFRVYELANPAAPALRSSDTYGGSYSDYSCMTSWESGSTKAVALGTNAFGLWIINTTDATAPLVSGIYNPVANYRVKALAKGPNYLYVSAAVASATNPYTYSDSRLESLTVTNLANPTRRWVTSTGVNAGAQGVFDNLAYISSPAGKFLVGTRPDQAGDYYDLDPLLSSYAVYEIPPGFLTNEGVPFPLETRGLAHVGGAGNIARSADGSKALLCGGPAGLYQLTLPTTWAPGYAVQPLDQSACPGGSAAYTAIASANPTAITYQWYRDDFRNPVTPLVNGPTPWGSTISGATEIQLSLGDLHAADRAYYYCLATNACGSTQSFWAALGMCAGDFNCSGSITVQDIFDYLSAYFAGDPRADFNGVGGVTVQDLFEYLAAYFTVCF